MRRRVVRLLDGLVLASLALGLVLVATGGFDVGLGAMRVPLHRVEDLLVAAVILGLARHVLQPYLLTVTHPRRVLALGVAGYVAVFTFISLTRHYMFRTHALDLGLYDQINWLLASGYPPVVTMPDMHAWGDHLTFIQYLLGLVYLAVDRVEAILVVQSFALGAGAVAVFAFARARLGDDRLAALCASLFLLNPSLHGINIRDFHPQAMAVPLLLGAIYCFEVQWRLMFWAFALLALSVREDAGLAIVGLGLWAVVRRRWPTGVALVALGLGWIVLATTVIIPAFRGEPYSHLHARYGWLGNSVVEILLGILRNPVAVAGVLASADRLLYLAAILAPFGFLPLAAPLALLPVLPALAQNILSLDPVLFHHRTQYNVFVLPFVAVAAVLGVKRVRDRYGDRRTSAVLGVAFLVSVALTSRTANDLMVSRWWPNAAVRDRHIALAKVPPAAPISAEERFVPHLSHRRQVWVFPGGIERAEYVLGHFDCRVPHRSAWHVACAQERVMLSHAASGIAHDYVVAADAGGLVLLRRSHLAPPAFGSSPSRRAGD